MLPVRHRFAATRIVNGDMSYGYAQDHKLHKTSVVSSGMNTTASVITAAERFASPCVTGLRVPDSGSRRLCYTEMLEDAIKYRQSHQCDNPEVIIIIKEDSLTCTYSKPCDQVCSHS